MSKTRKILFGAFGGYLALIILVVAFTVYLATTLALPHTERNSPSS